MVGGQRNAPAAFHRERTCTHCIGGWVGPMAGLDGKFHVAGIRSRIIQHVASRYTDWLPPPTHIYIILTILCKKLVPFKFRLWWGQPGTTTSSVGVHLPQSVLFFLRRPQPALLEPKYSLQTDSFLQNQLAKRCPSFPNILTNQ